MVKIINGNLLSDMGRFYIKCHQVNCYGVMGSGLAAQIKKKYPHVYAMYQQKCSKAGNPSFLLGNIQIVHCGDCCVANLFAQLDFGRDKIYTNYVAFEECISLLYEETRMRGCAIAFPYGIGCGLAGGDWDVIERIIRKYFEKSDIDCVIVRRNYEYE